MKRYDLMQVNASYTTDHQMEPSDDGEWVRYADVEAQLDALTYEHAERLSIHSWEMQQAAGNGRPIPAAKAVIESNAQ
jgi:hypothetical protein